MDAQRSQNPRGRTDWVVGPIAVGTGRCSETVIDYLRAVIVTKDLCTTTPGGCVATHSSRRGIRTRNLLVRSQVHFHLCLSAIQIAANEGLEPTTARFATGCTSVCACSL